jgi:hypothetical protein
LVYGRSGFLLRADVTWYYTDQAQPPSLCILSAAGVGSQHGSGRLERFEIFWGGMNGYTHTSPVRIDYQLYKAIMCRG